MNTVSISRISTLDILQNTGILFSTSFRNTDPFRQILPDPLKVFTEEITYSFLEINSEENKVDK